VSTEERPTAEDFVEVTTWTAKRRHVAEKDWLKRTLCGLGDTMTQEQLDRFAWTSPIRDLQPCKQCDKSRTRRIEGRRS
jgi:hypothetical protein